MTSISEWKNSSKATDSTPVFLLTITAFYWIRTRQKSVRLHLRNSISICQISQVPLSLHSIPVNPDSRFSRYFPSGEGLGSSLAYNINFMSIAFLYQKLWQEHFKAILYWNPLHFHTYYHHFEHNFLLKVYKYPFFLQNV